MRVVLVLALVTLGGCYSIRHRNDNADAAAAGDKAALTRTEKKKEAKQVLPAGLGGDTEHRAYTDAPPN